MNNNSDDMLQLNDEFDFKNIKRKIFKDSIGAVAVLDTDGKIESINEDFKKQFGYDDLIGKDITEFILKNEKWDNILTSLNTDNESTGEIELQTKDGSTFNSYYIADLIRNEKSKPVLISVNFIPENETYKVIKQLRDSKRTYQNICNTYEYLYQATLTLAKKTDLKDIIKTIADEAKNLMNASDCTVYLANYEREVLEPFYTNDPNYKEQIMSYDIPFGEGEAGRVAEKGKSRFLNIDDQRDHLVTIPGTEDDDTEEESILTVPLFEEDKVNGVLSLSKKNYNFDYDDINKLKAFAKQAEVALHRANELEKLQKSKEILSQEKQKIEALHKVARDLEKCDSEEKIYDITLDATKNILDFYICSIMIKEDDNLVMKATIDEEINKGNEFSIDEGIYGKTYREQKSFIVNNINKADDAKPTSDEFRSVLSVPIGKYGVFQTLSDEENFFDEDDQEITELLISHVKEAIRQVRDKRLIREREKKLEALHDVATRLESCGSEEEAYDIIINASEDVLNFDMCRIHIVEGNKLRVKAISSKLKEPKEKYTMLLDEGIAGKTYQNNKSYIIDNLEKDKDARPLLNDYKSGISVPIGKFGVLQAISYKSDDFSKEDIELAELLTSHLSEALNRIKSETR
ncbi:MAG: GAF domain-containing protein, partial [Thermoplasmatota archaeon]